MTSNGKYYNTRRPFTTYYHADGDGNITALLTTNEYLGAKYLYGPFGQIIGKWGGMADANEMQFSSMPHDYLSGLSLYPFRAYRPDLQRWPNQDPIQELGGINLYRFVGNGPVNNRDFWGLDFSTWIGAGPAYSSFLNDYHNDGGGNSNGANSGGDGESWTVPAATVVDGLTIGADALNNAKAFSSEAVDFFEGASKGMNGIGMCLNGYNLVTGDEN